MLRTRQVAAAAGLGDGAERRDVDGVARGAGAPRGPRGRGRWCGRARRSRRRGGRPARGSRRAAVSRPSERSTMTRERAGSARMRFSARPRPSEMAVERPVMPISALVDGAGDGGEVPGERRRDVGAVGEDDDADAVAAAGLDEAGGDALDGVEARGGLAVEREVLDRHRAGEVEGEDDVAARGGAVGDLRPGAAAGRAATTRQSQRATRSEAGAVEARGARRCRRRRRSPGGR